MTAATRATRGTWMRSATRQTLGMLWLTRITPASAADLVFRRLAGDRSPPYTHVIPTTLHARGSGEIAVV